MRGTTRLRADLYTPEGRILGRGTHLASAATGCQTHDVSVTQSRSSPRPDRRPLLRQELRKLRAARDLAWWTIRGTELEPGSRIPYARSGRRGGRC
jgi:hypothetical protein